MNQATQTNRKNKTKQTLNLPTTAYYTLKELFAVNPQFGGIEITIRVRHTKEIEAGRVVEIGTLTGGLGRPQSVYALTPVSKMTLDKAEANNIDISKYNDNIKKIVVPTMDINTPAKTQKPLAVVNSN
jgi:hypothetical protein